jgi:hypothetical protein
VGLPAERCTRALRWDVQVAFLTAGLSTPNQAVKRLRLLAESLTFEPVAATPHADAGASESAAV